MKIDRNTFAPILGYKYLLSKGDTHTFGKFTTWRYLYVDVTTEQIENGQLETIITNYENKRKGIKK